MLDIEVSFKGNDYRCAMSMTFIHGVFERFDYRCAIIFIEVLITGVQFLCQFDDSMLLVECTLFFLISLSIARSHLIMFEDVREKYIQTNKQT